VHIENDPGHETKRGMVGSARGEEGVLVGYGAACVGGALYVFGSRKVGFQSKAQERDGGGRGVTCS
jgi:hypothetical protein